MKVVIVPKCDWLVPISFEMQPTIDIESIQKTYENYYRTKNQNSNKSLDWVYYFGTIECKFKSVNSTYFLQCRPYQYFVIKLFEKFASLKFSDMKKFLMMKEDGYLLSIVQSMMVKNPKKRLLTTDPPISGDQCKKLLEVLKENPDLKFVINPSYKSKTKKVVLKDAKFAEKKIDSGTVEVERKHAVQSVIVRVMKSRKEMEYSELVREVEKLMFKFRPTTRVKIFEIMSLTFEQLVRHQVDVLIRKEFIERVTGDMNKLRYVA